MFRQALVVVATGSGLLLGGVSVSRQIDRHPSLLYAAGEAHVMLGDKQGGLALMGRAEQLRRSLDRNANQVPADIKSDPKPVEICKNRKTSSLEQKLNPDAAKHELVMAAAFSPQRPATPPSFAFTPPHFPVVPAEPGVTAGFDAAGRYWAHVRIGRVRQFEAEQAARNAEHQRILVETKMRKVQSDVHSNVDVAAILRDVRDNLKRNHVPVSSVVLVNPPVVNR
jgi:hypothetical protein